jgi:hypothetical protein
METKKTAVLILAALTAAVACAKGRGGHRPPPPPHHHHHHHHHGSAWGKGGRNFWPGFIGGVAAGLAARTVAEPTTVVVTPTVVAPAPVVVTPAPIVVTPAPVVVQPPVYQTQNVWVEGRYVDTVQPNGTTVRAWQPGHYEQRTVQVQ